MLDSLTKCCTEIDFGRPSKCSMIASVARAAAGKMKKLEWKSIIKVRPGCPSLLFIKAKGPIQGGQDWHEHEKEEQPFLLEKSFEYLVHGSNSRKSWKLFLLAGFLFMRHRDFPSLSLHNAPDFPEFTSSSLPCI